MAEQFMSVLQAAQKLNVSTRTIQYMCDDGRLGSERVARMRLVLRVDVERIASKQKEQAAA